MGGLGGREEEVFAMIVFCLRVFICTQREKHEKFTVIILGRIYEVKLN